MRFASHNGSIRKRCGKRIEFHHSERKNSIIGFSFAQQMVNNLLMVPIASNPRQNVATVDGIRSNSLTERQSVDIESSRFCTQSAGCSGACDVFHWLCLLRCALPMRAGCHCRSELRIRIPPPWPPSSGRLSAPCRAAKALCWGGDGMPAECRWHNRPDGDWKGHSIERRLQQHRLAVE